MWRRTETESNRSGLCRERRAACTPELGEDNAIMRRIVGFRPLAGMGFLAAIGVSGRAQAPSPRDVLERFCKLDAQEGQLTPGGWQRLADLFSAPGAPQLGSIDVVRDFGVSPPALEKDKAMFYVEYFQLGRIDPSQARFFFAARRQGPDRFLRRRAIHGWTRRSAI